MTDHISAGSFGCNWTLAVNSKGGFIGHLIKKPQAGLAAAGSVSLVSASESLLTPMCSCSSSLGKRENLSKSQRRKKRLDSFWLGFCVLTEMNQLWPGIGCAYWADTHTHTGQTHTHTHTHRPHTHTHTHTHTHRPDTHTHTHTHTHRPDTHTPIPLCLGVVTSISGSCWTENVGSQLVRNWSAVTSGKVHESLVSKLYLAAVVRCKISWVFLQNNYEILHNKEFLGPQDGAIQLPRINESDKFWEPWAMETLVPFLWQYKWLQPLWEVLV